MSRRPPKSYDLRLLRGIWRFLRPHRGSLGISLMLLPIASFLQLLPPYFLKRGIDDAVVPGRYELLPPLAVALLGTIVLWQVCAFLQTLFLQIAGQRAMHDLRGAVHRHLLGLRASFFDRVPVGQSMTRVTNDVESIAEAFGSGVIALIGDAFILMGIVVAMFLLDVHLASVTISILPILVFAIVLFQRLLRRTYRQIRRRLGRLNAALQEQIRGVKVIQMFGREARTAERFDKLNAGYRDSYNRSIRLDATLFAFVEMFGSITVATLLWYGGLRIVGGVATFGLLVAFIEYVQKLFIPIRDLSAKFSVMQQALAAAERVFGLLATDEPDAPEYRGVDANALTVAAAGAPHVEFDHVHFAYKAGFPILPDLSFGVARGEKLALVGATGSGKSTIIRLLIRLYELDQGAIRLSGKDIRSFDVHELRRAIVVLNQDGVLFAGSVRDNIRLGRTDITESAIRDAAERVGLLSRIALDAEVLSHGKNLSQGERQLMLFARALAHQPEVLVLDEATANVDPASEALIQQGTAELIRDRTAIIIAHRLTTIEKADRVLVLRDGRVVESGNHRELIHRGGLYAHFYRLQYLPGAAA